MPNKPHSEASAEVAVSLPLAKKWFHVFAFPSLRYICDVRAVSADNAYDPRINGDGNVIWQEASNRD